MEYIFDSFIVKNNFLIRDMYTSVFKYEKLKGNCFTYC